MDDTVSDLSQVHPCLCRINQIQFLTLVDEVSQCPSEARIVNQNRSLKGSI